MLPSGGWYCQRTGSEFEPSQWRDANAGEGRKNLTLLQRFFQHVVLGEDWTARLVIRMLGLSGNWHLCLDRTKWKIGRKQINLLVLAVATRRYRIPLIWTVLGKASNSSTKERIAVMKRYLDLFWNRNYQVPPGCPRVHRS